MPEDVLSLDQKPLVGETTFFKHLDVKRVLLCFHGFQTSPKHDLQDFKDYFETKNTDPNFEVVLVNLFDFGDKTTYSKKKMFIRADAAVNKYLGQGYIVYLLSYSYSAGIAAKLCSMYPDISKLVLISPTTYLIKTKLLVQYIKVSVGHLKFQIRYRQRAKKMMKKTKTDGMLKLALAIATAITRYRKYLKKLRCKVFMIKGNKDEYSISNTFSYVSNKAKDAITITKIYPNETHTMIMSVEHGKRAFDDILAFIFHMEFGEERQDINF